MTDLTTASTKTKLSFPHFLFLISILSLKGNLVSYASALPNSFFYFYFFFFRVFSFHTFSPKCSISREVLPFRFVSYHKLHIDGGGRTYIWFVCDVNNIKVLKTSQKSIGLTLVCISDHEICKLEFLTSIVQFIGFLFLPKFMHVQYHLLNKSCKICKF